MRVIVLNRKRIGVTLIIIGLMLVLVGAEVKLNERLKMTALMQSGLDSLKQYEVKAKGIKYKLPENWTTTERNFGGGEILYHNDFSSKDGTINGFTEVWNLRQQDLKTFLENSKQSAYKPDKYREFKYVPIKVNNEPGYLLTYNVTSPDRSTINAYEYYVQENGIFFRMAFYVQSDKFRENLPTIFEAIANTFEKD